MIPDTHHDGLGFWMEAAFQADDWTEALEASCRFTGARAMVMAVQDDPQNAPDIGASSQADPAFLGLCTKLLTHLGPHESGRSVMETGAFASWIVHDCNGAGGRVALFALSDAPLDRMTFECVAALACSAVSAKARVDAMRATSALKGSALDKLPFGVAIVNEEMAIEEMNMSGRAILRRGDGLSVCRGRLLCRANRDQSMLSRAVRDSIAVRSYDNIVRIARSGGAQPYVVRPIGPDGSRATRSNCLLMIVDPDVSAPSAARIWRAMFDLTDCELIIAKAMVSGRRIADIASERGVSIETVRSQTKRMFERLNVSSQAEAAARLNRTAPFCDDGADWGIMSWKEPDAVLT